MLPQHECGRDRLMQTAMVSSQLQCRLTALPAVAPPLLDTAGLGQLEGVRVSQVLQLCILH